MILRKGGEVHKSGKKRDCSRVSSRRKGSQLVLLRLVGCLFICSDFLFILRLLFFSMSLISFENNMHLGLFLNLICFESFPYPKPMD